MMIKFLQGIAFETRINRVDFVDFNIVNYHNIEEKEEETSLCEKTPSLPASETPN